MSINNFKKNKQIFYKNSERVTHTTDLLNIRIASPIKLRWLCTRKTSEGLTVGHIWNEITVNHKNQKPFPGGLFCESIFGPLNRGICACKKTHWRNYPQTPKKLIRFKILHCLYCSTQTIYRVKKLRTFSQFFPIGMFENDVEHHLEKISCKCGRTKIQLFKFFPVIRTCRFCISSTKKHTFKKTLTYNHYFRKYKKDKIISNFELINSNYQPGFCHCGLTNTEVPWDASICCRYCATDVYVSSKLFPRRHRIGFLPLSLPMAHIWYYRFRNFPLIRLSGFTRRTFSLILHCEIIVAEELFLYFNEQTQLYFSSIFKPPLSPSYSTSIVSSPSISKNQVNDPVSFIQSSITKNSYPETHIVSYFKKRTICAFPWYCLYRNSIFFPFEEENISKSSKRLKRLRIILVPKRMHPGKTFNFCKSLSSTKKIPSEKKLGIRIEKQKLPNIVIRTGNSLVFNRLQNQVDSLLQYQQRFKTVKKSIELFETTELQSKQNKSQYRYFVQIQNQIINQFRIRIEIQLSSLQPTFIILHCVPVLPPDKRPIMFLGEGGIIVSDLNILYQKVIRRNHLLAIRKKTITTRDPDLTNFYYRERLLREGLECLFGSKSSTHNRKHPKQRVLKSISAILRGKYGRFRNNLLGKRVDYSARSVIIPGPELSLNQCGIPYEIVLTLFQPFFIRFLKGQVRNGHKIRSRFQARQFLQQEISERWARRTQILNEFPVLLNRAPTLHRFNFQSFQPVLSQSRAIQLHPLVCAGFNADFDGDQIAVHLPISFNSRYESWRLANPGSFFFSSAIGSPIFLPTQDIVRGIYFLTTRPPVYTIYRSIFININTLYSGTNSIKITDLAIFFRAHDVHQLIEKQVLPLHKFVWLYIPVFKILDCEYEPANYEIRLNQNGKYQEISVQHLKRKNPTIHLIQTTVGRILFSILPHYTQ